MNALSRTRNPTGSIWHRWEPHIHVPGTLLNNQYGSMSIDAFCEAVGALDPPVRALGITDYYVSASYEQVLLAKSAGKLPGVDLLFPNIEIRLDVGTVQGSAVNAHLLFSPDTPNHVAEINRFLASLSFRYAGDDFACTPTDLARLGRKHNQSLQTDEAAIREGALQFKISLTEVADRVKSNTWAHDNLLVAVAASSNDGSSGVRTPDHAFDALRTTIEACCHLIFSGNPKDAEFWSGRGALSVAQVEARYKSLKPCIHGSDAHSPDKIGIPSQQRFTWIKGDVMFESLRQACIEPAGRALVAAEPPRGSLVGETVQTLRVTNALWMVPPEIHLNSGMVAIIGARGSGKTALADALAVGGYSMSTHANERSFIRRAATFLTTSLVTLDWESGEQTSAPLTSFEDDELLQAERIQYLSQQFVDELCASDGVADRLLAEIKRVIFNAHDEIDREGAFDFDELYQQTCRSALDTRERCSNELEQLTNAYVAQTHLRQSVAELKKHIEEKEKAVSQTVQERTRMVGVGQAERVAQHLAVQKALSERKAALQAEQKRGRALDVIQASITDFRDRVAQGWVSNVESSAFDAGLTEEEWAMLIPEVSADADKLITTKLAATKKTASDLLGPAVPEVSEQDLAKPLIPNFDNLDQLSVNLLVAESQRLSKLIGIDHAKTQRYANLTKQIESVNRQIEGLRTQLKKAEQADSELAKLRSRIKAVYLTIFASIMQLAEQLEELYSPLGSVLQGETGALSKMRFGVRRSANVAAWAAEGEQLFDLRKDGPFKGRGSLHSAAVAELVTAWEQGTPEEAVTAVDDFVKKYGSDLNQHRLDSIPHPEWLGRVWAWLFATEHITVSYSVQYGDVDIEKLSPGTRGIVLLLLYLAIDQEDVRPLIIDQPEENLDPQSVYDELVERFRQAKRRRQIIVVTHNANLVVNADAEQVIVATAGQHELGKLPEIKYESGGLENAYIRQKVCEILEGGENAFRERARRLRLVIR